MRKYNLTILFIFAVVFAKAQNAQSKINQLSSCLAKSTEKVIKAINIPKDSKLAICLFLGSDNKSDTIKSRMGIKLSAAFYHDLLSEFNKKDIQIIFPDGIENKMLNDQSGRYFVPPSSTADEDKFWSGYLDKQRPDYFITASYHFTKDDNIEIIGAQITPYKFGQKIKAYGIDCNCKVSISPNESTELEQLNKTIHPLGDNLTEVINFTAGSNNSFFTATIKDANTNSDIKNNTLKINGSYYIELDLFKDAYLYVLSYSNDDKLHPWFDVYWPEPNKNTLAVPIETPIKAGKNIQIPSQYTIAIDPPTGDALIKIIATTETLPIKFDVTKDKEGYILARLSSKQAKALISRLKNIDDPLMDAQTQEFLLKITD